MTERPLGRTPLVVSRLGLGLAAVARPGYITLGREHDLPAERTPEALYARAAALLDAAREASIRYLDVARSYGRSEEFLARWLEERGVARDAVTVGSKWGYRYTAGWSVEAVIHEQKELSLARFRTQLAESRALLDGRLDLYQIHSATAESGCLEDVRLLEALVAGRREGAYRAVGLTLSGPTSERTLELACGVRVDGERVFDAVQATFNCLEPSLARTLAAAHDEGLGVIVKEAFANGRLSGANALPADAALLARLRAIGARRGSDPSQIALAFVLEQPFVDVVLSGAATVDQLRAHVGALDVTLDDEARGVLAELAEPPASYWATRASLPWH
jgi:aryl-alcohol dehydrogenase-like predicted oxidoreductase